VAEITPIPISLLHGGMKQETNVSLTPSGEPRDEAREEFMEDQQYFLQKANRCFEIGRECIDLAAARKINELGNEFLNKAPKSERRDARLPLWESDRDFTDFR